MEPIDISARDRFCAILLAAILALALALRLRGMWFGYPLALHPDEPAIVNNALHMIATGDLNPHFFNYPSLNIYLQVLFSRLTILASRLFLGQSAADIPTIRYYLVGRSFVVLQSVLTILITYEIGRRLLSRLSGLLAAMIMVFAFLHVSNSFLLTVDSPAAFWSTLATLTAVMIFTNGKRLPYYLLGGLFAGLATGSKYTAVVSIAPILVAHLVQSHKDRRWIDWNIAGAVGVAALTFFLTTPYALLDYQAFLAAIRFESKHYRTGHTGAEAVGRTSFLNYGQFLVETGYGLLPMILSGLGLVWLSVKAPARALLLLSTPLLLYLFVGQYKVYFPRNVVTLIPYLALLSGYFIASAYEWARAHTVSKDDAGPVLSIINLLLILAVAGTIYAQSALSVDYVRRITLPDTRWVSIEWLRDNLPAGSTVGREHYTPPLEEYADDLSVTYLGYNAVVGKPDEVNQMDYMIVSEGDYGRFLKMPDEYPSEREAYERFFQQNELVHEFVPDGKTLSGPKLRVYRIVRTPSDR